ncbi:hypothetical protein B0H15DRAFT_863386 [Mycena belliarum]|uniref:Uncharacterized protein n=1 Tax=Mycena belliarum TaxID=1033014 RepID=A0AAD6TWB8_9AGAR|nr:hypothetical protein B0H15DRAFT_863386 [Mycena belliae]
MRLGRARTQDAVGLIWETLFLSAYSVFFAIAIWSIVRKGMKSSRSILMLGIVVYLYATSLTLWGLNVTQWFERMSVDIDDHPELGLQDRLDADNAKFRALAPSMESLFLFNMLVGDSVVIWRVHALYPGTLWPRLVPCIPLLISLAFTTVDVICLTGAEVETLSSIPGGGPVCEHAELISWAFSFITNVACTLLIWYRAWHHRKTTKALSMGTNSARISTTRILSLLVESGFIYCLFWLTQLILFIDIERDAPAFYVYELFAGMGDQISGMYPTLIIVIVNLHRTIWDLAPGTDKKGSAVRETLRFAEMRSTDATASEPEGARVGPDSNPKHTNTGNTESVTVNKELGQSQLYTSEGGDV